MGGRKGVAFARETTASGEMRSNRSRRLPAAWRAAAWGRQAMRRDLRENPPMRASRRNNRALEHARRFPHGEMRRIGARGVIQTRCEQLTAMRLPWKTVRRSETRRHSLSERCILSRSIACGDNANISAGAADLPAERLVKAPRPTDVQARPARRMRPGRLNKALYNR